MLKPDILKLLKITRLLLFLFLRQYEILWKIAYMGWIETRAKETKLPQGYVE